MTLQMLVDRYIINEKIELGAGCQPAGVAIPKFMKSHLPKCGMLTPEGVSLVIGRGGLATEVSFAVAISVCYNVCLDPKNSMMRILGVSFHFFMYTRGVAVLF